jgi:lipoprotein-anchoring transpeptidase ErfK/SrfK
MNKVAKYFMFLVLIITPLSYSKATDQTAISNESNSSTNSKIDLTNFESIIKYVEENPSAPDVEFYLEKADQLYETETGINPQPFGYSYDFNPVGGCYRQSCPVWAHVSKRNQRLYVYINGKKTYEWKVSTGKSGHGTPNFDKNPDGRIYQKYSSGKYPGGDYNGLGNMPYAVFISGGFAIHGTPAGNWKFLGTPASHGCIRVHPSNAQIFNKLVRTYGISNVWISVNSDSEYHIENDTIASAASLN